MTRFDVFARAGMHGNDPDIQRIWIWMDAVEAASAEAAVRAVFDECKTKYPESWAEWALADFKGSKNPGVPFGEPGYSAALRAVSERSREFSK